MVNLAKRMQKMLCTALFLTLAINLAFAKTSNATTQPIKPSVETMTEELKLFKAELASHPGDAQLHFKVAELYRNLGQKENAAKQYAKATEIDPNIYLAFHQLAALTDSPELLNPAIEKLTKQSQEKPKELMLRVALSELLEKRGNFYLAARTLIDMTYANDVPEKYKAKVAARIHFLLVQQKKSEQEEVQNTVANEEELDIVPAPLPASTTKRSIASAKMKDSKEVNGMGNVPLLP